MTTLPRRWAPPVDCMACLAHAAETGDPGDVRFATSIDDMTHYATKTGADMAYPLCDFDLSGFRRGRSRWVSDDELLLVAREWRAPGR